MTVEAVATAYYARQRVLAARVAQQFTVLWGGVTQADLDAAWEAIADRLNATLTAAQLLAASQADSYVGDVLAEQGVDTQPEGQLRPRALAGFTADGRPNTSLLARPLIAAKVWIGRGADPVDAVDQATRFAGALAATEVADTGRSAVAVATTSRPRIESWVRRARGGTCDRCLALTVRPYAWNADFDRHPNDDCVAIPTTTATAERLVTSAAPVAQSGMTSIAEISRRSRGRKAPDQIITDADSRAAAIEQLRRAGYLT